MIELLHGPLSLAKCVEAVRGAERGGMVTFIGSVRGTSNGKRVIRLEYEAYEPMALEKLNEVTAECKERWPVQSIAIQHRLGLLKVGDDAVIIAVACAHRGEAFEACRFVIDRIKQIVPIWKKEFGEAGEVWVDGPQMEPETIAASRERD